MNDDNLVAKRNSWKNWLIKKLLTSESTKEEILNYIASETEVAQVEELNDNNEKNLIKNILKLEEKSVEDVMVPRGEIISVEKNNIFNFFLLSFSNDLLTFIRWYL